MNIQANIQTLKNKTINALDILSEKIKTLAIKVYNAFRYPKDAMKCFYLLFVVSVLCFIYTWINEGCTVPLSGDYSLQEMTFLFNGYDDWHYFFKTGEFVLWDRSVFLGLDNIGGNSFYYLFDPFFLILLPFPRDWLLVLQGLEFVPKLVIAGMLFYWFLNEFNLSNKTRTIGALAFAFTGYSACYLWFHFIDSVAFLPLCFLGVERIIRRKDPRIFLVGFFLVSLSSYFFFVVYMIGLFLYAIFRYLQEVNKRTYEDNLSILGVGMLSFICAVLLGCFTLLPGMSVATSMPRVNNDSYLTNLFSATSIKELLSRIFVFDSGLQHNQVTPLLNFLFPADDCYYSNLLNVNYYDNLAGSLYATTPMLIIFFVGLIDAIKRKKISYILGFILTAFLCFTPFGFYLFSGFTVPYARFFIIPITYMVIFDCLTIERRREIPKTYLDISLIFIGVLYAVSCYLMIYEVDIYPSHFTTTQWDFKMWLIIISTIYLLICYFVMRPLFHSKKFAAATIVLMSVNIIAMYNATIYIHGLSSISQNEDYAEETGIVELLKESENNEDFYRIYNSTATRNNSNVPLREGYSGLSDFHSVYPFNAQDFLDRSRIPHGYHNWSMGIYNRRYNLETFLGTKYYLVDRVEENFKTNSIPVAYPYRKDSSGYTVYALDYDIPYGYKNVLSLTDEEKEELGIDYSEELFNYLSSDKCSKSLYVNTNFIDLGFAYDSVINTAWLATNLYSYTTGDDYYYNLYEDVNEYPLLRYAMLDNDDYETFLANKKYNAGEFNFYGDNYSTTQLENKGYSLYEKARLFQNSITSLNTDYIAYDENADYINNTSLSKPTNPIQVFSSSSSRTKRMQVTVYSANWPATSSTPSGEYAVCDPNDASNQVCVSTYKEEHPFEYANGIRQADTKFDLNSLRDEDGNQYENSVLYNTKLVITAYDGNGNQTVFCPDANKDDPTSGCYISIFDTDNIEWRLFDEDDNLISFARHPYVNYKQAHGYYTDRPVKTIIGILKSGSKSSPVTLKKPYLYIQRNSSYQRAIDKLKENKINIVSRSENTTTFTTSYDSDKFLVLNYPLQDGWTVKKKNKTTGEYEDVTLYKAQGGFISFEAVSGEQEYVLNYETPYLKLGYMATALGLFVTCICLGFFAYRDHMYKITYDTSLKVNSEKLFKEEKFKYDDCIK